MFPFMDLPPQPGGPWQARKMTGPRDADPAGVITLAPDGISRSAPSPGPWSRRRSRARIRRYAGIWTGGGWRMGGVEWWPAGVAGCLSAGRA